MKRLLKLIGLEIGKTAIWLPYGGYDLMEGDGCGPDYEAEFLSLTVLYFGLEFAWLSASLTVLVTTPLIAEWIITWRLVDGLLYMAWGVLMRISLRRWDFLN